MRVYSVSLGLRMLLQVDDVFAVTVVSALAYLLPSSPSAVTRSKRVDIYSSSINSTV